MNCNRCGNLINENKSVCFIEPNRADDIYICLDCLLPYLQGNAVTKLPKEKITHETRRESFKRVEKTLNKREQQVLAALGDKELTPLEVVAEMIKLGYVDKADCNVSNRAAPRLTELEKRGILEVVEKRKCSISTSKGMVSVYRRVRNAETEDTHE